MNLRYLDDDELDQVRHVGPFYSPEQIRQRGELKRLESMERALGLRRAVLEVVGGMMFGLLLLVLMAAPWS